MATNDYWVLKTDKDIRKFPTFLLPEGKTRKGDDMPETNHTVASSIGYGIGAIIAIVFISCFIGLLQALPLYLTWNHILIGGIPSFQPISFWGAFGMAVTLNLLFGRYFPRSDESSEEKR